MEIIRKETGTLTDYPLETLGDPERLLFFDIETTGFSPESCSVYLIGAVYRSAGSWRMIQWFAGTPDEEEGVLRAFMRFASSFALLVHFNGEQFDIPFVKRRMEKLCPDAEQCWPESLDIYKIIRPWKKFLGLDSLKQKSLERFLGIEREDAYNGGELIKVYRDAQITGSKSLRRLLLLHNEEDVLGLPALLSLMSYESLLRGSFDLESCRCIRDDSGTERALSAVFSGAAAVPAAVTLHTEAFGPIALRENRITLRIPLYRGELRHYYANYKDYYYLPAEDNAIHKSVGQYVAPEARKKATARTCYTRAEGVFLPEPEEIFPMTMREDYQTVPLYAPYYPEMAEDAGRMAAYLRALLALMR